MLYVHINRNCKCVGFNCHNIVLKKNVSIINDNLPLIKRLGVQQKETFFLYVLHLKTKKFMNIEIQQKIKHIL